MSLTEEFLSQLPGDILSGLRRADRLLASLRADTASAPMVVKQSQMPLGSVDWDVVICGGTLGILIGCALAQLGWRVALIERGMLRGREQEWNISRKELEVFLELNLLTADELESAITTQYNPARVSFQGGAEIWVEDVLNIGVDPVFLLETLKQRFLAAGGSLLENTPFAQATVHPDGVVVETVGEAEGQRSRGAEEQRSTKEENHSLLTFKTRLLLDAMGHFSPITGQARHKQKPDGICLVVGSCAQGFGQNDAGDLLVSFTPIQHNCQYFWEAFPARDGRTTYLFTYMNAHPDHLGLEDLFEEYLRLLPEYQGVELSQLQPQRALFGFFPSYRKSPLKSPWNRILPVGDSSGNQSPLSFGGFGAMVRHLKRLTFGIHEALSTDELSISALALLAPYQPSLSVTWLFQKAMRTDFAQKTAPNQINQLLSSVFVEMQQLGNLVLKPFLQDVVQFKALTQTLLKTAIANPLLVAKVIPQVGLGTLLNWMVHYFNLGAYSALFELSKSLQVGVKNLPPGQQYYFHRWFDAWQYGSGGDYHEKE
jgi:lycopene cyclase CruP